MAGGRRSWFGLGFVVLLAAAQIVLAADPADAIPPAARPRLLILTDIGGDPDDQQSMIRLMLYSNEFELEGLVASAAGTPGELKECITRPELIREIIQAYGKVRPNLLKRSGRYPAVEDLLAKVKSGNPNRGKDAVGEIHDTEGSAWIISAVDRDDPRPLNIAIWGGQTDLAQALWRVRKDRGAEGLAKFVARLRVHDIADQDKIAAWMWDEFPGMFYILSSAYPGKDRREGAFRGMYLGGDDSLVSRAWMEQNIRQDHGPLGAIYPPRTSTAPSRHAATKEGDTPSWFYFLPNGLSDPEHPEWGCWGGRFVLDAKLGGGRSRIFRDARDTVGDVTDARATVWRWRPAFQMDFQRRLDWCNKEDSANDDSLAAVTLNGDRSGNVLKIDAISGEALTLTRGRETASSRATWFVYPEAGTYSGDVPLRAVDDGLSVTLTAPDVTEPRTIHVILHLLVGKEPSLSLYRRAVITVRPGKR